MNAPDDPFVKSFRSLGAKLLVSGLAAGLLSGCIANPFVDAQVDPRSPVAGDVAKLVKADAAYPTFASVPAAPKDMRPRKQYGIAAANAADASADLAKMTGDRSWTLRDTEGFASAARLAAGPDLGAAQAIDTEAFAAALRRRATPPPPAKH